MKNKMIHIFNSTWSGDKTYKYLATVSISEWRKIGYQIESRRTRPWHIEEKEVDIIPEHLISLTDLGWRVPEKMFYEFTIMKELKKEVEK